jgi:heptosyltransferase-1
MKVLILKTSSMGDIIHTFPAVTDASERIPVIAFDWCVEEGFSDIVALHPAVGRIHRVAVRRWRNTLLRGATWEEAAWLRRTLRQGGYDLVIDAQGLVKSAVTARLAGAPVAGLDQRSARERAASLLYDRRYHVSRDRHAVERTRLLFGQALGYHPDLSLLRFGIVPPAASAGPEAGGRTAFLLHGTSRADKEWPVAQWIETARMTAQRGLTPVVTFANETERQVATSIVAAVPQTRLVPKSPLAEIAALIGRSALVIGADTGLTHLASAFGVPTVGIFVATRPGLTGPLGDYASALVAAEGEPISPERVAAEAGRLLDLRSRQA